MLHQSPRIADLFQRSFLKYGLSFLAIAVLSASSCPTDADDSLCGNEDSLYLLYITPAQALTTPDLEVTLSGGVRTFTWSRIVENACSEEKPQIKWSIAATTAKIPAGFRVDAGYAITSVLGSFVTLTPTEKTDYRLWEATTEISLRQAYQGQPGRYLPFMSISFTSKGDIQADKEVVQAFWRLSSLESQYKRAKSN